jgi:hypothetical protein
MPSRMPLRHLNVAVVVESDQSLSRAVDGNDVGLLVAIDVAGGDRRSGIDAQRRVGDGKQFCSIRTIQGTQHAHFDKTATGRRRRTEHHVRLAIPVQVHHRRCSHHVQRTRLHRARGPGPFQRGGQRTGPDRQGECCKRDGEKETVDWVDAPGRRLRLHGISPQEEGWRTWRAQEVAQEGGQAWSMPGPTHRQLNQCRE